LSQTMLWTKKAYVLGEAPQKWGRSLEFEN